MEYFNVKPEVVGRAFRDNEQSHIFRRERTGDQGWSHSVRPAWSHDTTDEWILEWLTEVQVDDWLKAHVERAPLTVDDTLDFMVAFDTYEWPEIRTESDPAPAPDPPAAQ
jgi:hypothetical protein